MTWPTHEPPLPWPWKREQVGYVYRSHAVEAWRASFVGAVVLTSWWSGGDIICLREGQWADMAPPHPTHITRYGWTIEADQ